jgi:hypothetical protein
MKISTAQIDSLREALTKLPPPPKVPNGGTKKGAIAALAPELLRLRRQGYGLETLAAFLREKGLAISSGTLKNYLQRAGATRTKRRKGTGVPALDVCAAQGPARLPAPPSTARPLPLTWPTAPGSARNPATGH